MLALAWPAQWFALIPIILVESEVFRRTLHLPFRSLIKPIGKANLVSTFVGIPLAWLGMLLLEFAVGYVGFVLLPKETEVPTYLQYVFFPFTAAWVAADSQWQIYFAFIILAVPFCVVSIIIEERVLRRSLAGHSVSVIRETTRRANILSYIMLSLLALLFPLLP